MRKLSLVLAVLVPLVLAASAHANNLPTSGTIALSDPAPHWDEDVVFTFTTNVKPPPKSFYVSEMTCKDSTGAIIDQLLWYGGAQWQLNLSSPQEYWVFSRSVDNWTTDEAATCVASLWLDYHNGTPQETFTGILGTLEFNVTA